MPAIIVACALAYSALGIGAPAQADDATTNTTTNTMTSSTTTPSDSVAEELTQPPVEIGPATAGITPTRGTQLQVTPPPPPPPPDAFTPPADTGSGRRVVYSKTQQTVWVFDDSNTIIKMHRVSGKQTPQDPAPGVYQVWSRSISTFAINNPSITWGHMVRFAKGGRDGNIGFHDIPIQYGQPVQSVDQLGQALSGGCVRQALDDAIWMWNFAQLGTIVVVTP